MNNQGFCDHCYSWGVIADPDRNMCTTCKEIENGRNAMRNERSGSKSVRSLSESNPRGRE